MFTLLWALEAAATVTCSSGNLGVDARLFLECLQCGPRQSISPRHSASTCSVLRWLLYSQRQPGRSQGRNWHILGVREPSVRMGGMGRFFTPLTSFMPLFVVVVVVVVVLEGVWFGWLVEGGGNIA